jgi:serine protease Do
VIQDTIRQLAVFAVDMDELTPEELEEIEHATWGNSNRTRQGDLVIVIGNVLGHGDGQFHGILGSNQSFETIIDGRFRMLGTDILTSPTGTGVLFNKGGEVIGLLIPGPWQREGGITANGIGISDLSLVLVRLLNGEPVPYFGVEGITITEELSYVLEIPPGVYVRHVTADSPAFGAGIQNGDIIVASNDEEIENKQQLLNEILSGEIGESIEVRVNRRGAEEYVEMYFTVVIESRQ